MTRKWTTHVLLCVQLNRPNETDFGLINSWLTDEQLNSQTSAINRYHLQSQSIFSLLLKPMKSILACIGHTSPPLTTIKSFTLSRWSTSYQPTAKKSYDSIPGLPPYNPTWTALHRRYTATSSIRAVPTQLVPCLTSWSGRLTLLANYGRPHDASWERGPRQALSICCQECVDHYASRFE